MRTFIFSNISVLKALACAALTACAGAQAADEWQQSASIQFHEMPWGRYTEIVIEELPSAEAAIETSQNPGKMAELTAQARSRAASMDGSLEDQAVVLLIPGLEYGMSGTFTNVRIESGNGISVKKDGRIGARLADSRTEYTGHVVISEFTEARLKGSYSADLYSEDMTEREIRARERDFVGRVADTFDISLAPPDPSAFDPVAADPAGYGTGIDPFNLPDVPEDLDASDAELLGRIQEAGVPPETQGAVLQMLRGMPPEMVDTVLESYRSSY